MRRPYFAFNMTIYLKLAIWYISEILTPQHCSVSSLLYPSNKILTSRRHHIFHKHHDKHLQSAARLMDAKTARSHRRRRQWKKCCNIINLDSDVLHRKACSTRNTRPSLETKSHGITFPPVVFVGQIPRRSLVVACQFFFHCYHSPGNFNRNEKRNQVTLCAARSDVKRNQCVFLSLRDWVSDAWEWLLGIPSRELSQGNGDKTFIWPCYGAWN